MEKLVGGKRENPNAKLVKTNPLRASDVEIAST